MAVSDELGLTAQPVLTLERRGNGTANRREDLRSLARLCRRFGVAGIVVGNPLHLSGEASPRAAKTQAFAAELGELTGLPIHLWDERLTTREAHEILYAGWPRPAKTQQSGGPGGGDADFAVVSGRKAAISDHSSEITGPIAVEAPLLARDFVLPPMPGKTATDSMARMPLVPDLWFRLSAL